MFSPLLFFLFYYFYFIFLFSLYLISRPLVLPDCHLHLIVLLFFCPPLTLLSSGLPLSFLLHFSSSRTLPFTCSSSSLAIYYSLAVNCLPLIRQAVISQHFWRDDPSFTSISFLSIRPISLTLPSRLQAQ